MSEETPKKSGRPVNLSTKLKKSIDDGCWVHAYPLGEIIGKDQEYAREVLLGSRELTRKDTTKIFDVLGLTRLDLGMSK